MNTPIVWIKPIAVCSIHAFVSYLYENIYQCSLLKHGNLLDPTILRIRWIWFVDKPAKTNPTPVHIPQWNVNIGVLTQREHTAHTCPANEARNSDCGHNDDYHNGAGAGKRCEPVAFLRSTVHLQLRVQSLQKFHDSLENQLATPHLCDSGNSDSILVEGLILIVFVFLLRDYKEIIGKDRNINA